MVNKGGLFTGKRAKKWQHEKKTCNMFENVNFYGMKGTKTARLKYDSSRCLFCPALNAIFFLVQEK